MEAVALLPVVVAVGLAAGQVVAGFAAWEQAGSAAEAGAIALGRGQDVRTAVRRASGPRPSVAVRGRVVTVRVRPVVLLPGVGRLLEASVSADAGPR